MDRHVQALRIENLETQLGLRRFVCFSIELELELAASDQDRMLLTGRWLQAANEYRALYLAIDALKKE